MPTQRVLVVTSVALFVRGGHLFILVGVLEKMGGIEWIAKNVFLRIGNNPYVMVLVVLWSPGSFPASWTTSPSRSR